VASELVWTQLQKEKYPYPSWELNHGHPAHILVGRRKIQERIVELIHRGRKVVLTVQEV
jgi:hypothetical protein